MAEDNKKKTAQKKSSTKKRTTPKKVEVKEEVILTPVEENESSKTKNTFKLWEVITIMIVTFIVTAFVSGTIVYYRFNSRKVSCATVRKDLKEVIDVYDKIVNEYYGKVDKEQLIDNAISGMLYGLNDPYALFIDHDYGSKLDEELKGYFVGLGVEIYIRDDGKLEIVSLFEDAPADKAGVKVGDFIISMDGKEYDSSSIQELLDKIKSSKEGDEREFVFLRDGEEIKLKIELDKVDLPSATVELKDDIAVFTISNFANNTYDQFVKAYNSIKDKNIKAIIIDLRGNGGGYLASAAKLASLFLDKGDVIYQRSSEDSIEKVINNHDKVIDKPVVILADYGTASSSEAFAAALMDNLGAELVGTTTYGKGTIQELIELDDGRYAKFTVQEWLTAKGTKVDGVGLTPTVEIDFVLNGNEDNQLDKAIEIARGK